MKTDLPPEILDAIHANRKIAAIKLLRAHQNLGLRDAKDIVDAYIAENPQLINRKPAAEGSGPGFLLLVCVLVAIGFGVFKLLD